MAMPAARTLTIIAVTAVVSLGAGLGLSRLIVSPAEAAAAAAPPEAGPISVPVELRELSNDVVLRGDALYEDPLSITVETGDLGGPAVVTGQVPEVGATIDAGAVVLEVTGRPVILLAGDLPVYRTLRAGVSGPDVLQLKAALGALGIDPGNATSDTYDAATAAAVVRLYQRVGYPAPGAGEEADAARTAAAEGVRAAEEQLASARRELTAAGAGSTGPERVRAQAAVDTAQARLDEVSAACDADPGTCVRSEVVAAQGELATARAELAAVAAAPDTSAQQAAVTAAQRALTDARSALAKAEQGVLTPLPAGEVVYLPATPRRVDDVTVRRGSVLAGTPVMSVSGATLQIAGAVDEGDAALFVEGAPAVVALPSGGEVSATVSTIGGPAPDGAEVPAGRTRVVVVPDALTDEQRAELQGANVRVTVPVGATQGAVLAVPLAALTAGPGGESRVEVLDGEISMLVTVEVGLAADGFAEVTPLNGELAEGDRVVVGTTSSAGQGAADDEATVEPAEG
jgi:multidrug efflux pump subunit AcrA (membrane-fusion protein)